MARWLHCIGAGALAAGMIVGSPGLAQGCACGGVVSHDTAARVADEVALLAMDGHNETVIMRLNLRSTADNAALIVPTPTPATVSTASPSLFDELEDLPAPRTETRRHWSFGGRTGSEAAAPSGAAGPTVVNQVQLGPLEATTLAGGDVAGVEQWLASHGYTMRPEVVAQLDPYLQRGWAFVAMRLTGPTPLNGRLAPVKLAFGSDQLVYPMRMSAAARGTQRVVVYTLGPHRMQRVDSDAAAQRVDVDYAGSIAGRSHDETLSVLDDHGDFLTKSSVTISDPAAITSDFVFAPAPNDAPYQRVIYRDETEDITPFVLAGVFLAAVVAVIVTVTVLLLRRRKSAG